MPNQCSGTNGSCDDVDGDVDGDRGVEKSVHELLYPSGSCAAGLGPGILGNDRMGGVGGDAGWG